MNIQKLKFCYMEFDVICNKTSTLLPKLLQLFKLYDIEQHNFSIYCKIINLKSHSDY